MLTTWSSWRKTLACKSVQGEVRKQEKVSESNPGLEEVNWLNKSGCRLSFANLKGVIHSGRRVQAERRSVDGSECLENISQDKERNGNDMKNNHLEGRYGATTSRVRNFGPEGKSGRTFGSCYDCNVVQNPAASFVVYRGSLNAGVSIPHFEPSVCHRCGENFARYEALEHHHLVKHAVIELRNGDSARNIIEIIFRTSWVNSEMHNLKIDRILKVHNMQKTVARFEEYRDLVKLKASRIAKKHPRCLADGNELLRFYGTTLTCSLGMEISSSLCNLGNCNVCHIIRWGFSTRKESGKGIYTTATSGKAHDSVHLIEDILQAKRAIVVCRVIAGRVHKAHDTHETVLPPTGFDSVARGRGPYSTFQELYVFNPKAILPCFVVIYKC